MSGEGVHILYKLCFACFRGGPAHAGAHRNADAGGAANERAENELAFTIIVLQHPIEPGPVQSGHKLPYEGGNISHIGNGVTLGRG